MKYTKEAVGPSNVNADDWQKIIGSNLLGDHSLVLRKSLVIMTVKLCSQQLEDFESYK